MINKTLGNLFKGDKVIWMVFFFLCIISVIEVYSASSQLTYKGGSYIAPVLKHVWILLMGIFCMLVTMNIKCKYFKIVTPFLLLVSFLMLIWVLFAGHSTNGASRWIGFLGMQFQPSEIAKGALILATAQILSAMQTEHGADKLAFRYILFVCLWIVVPILLENFSTAILICSVIFMMMVIGRVPLQQLGKLIGVVAVFIAVTVLVVFVVGEQADKEEQSRQNTLVEQVDVAGAQEQEEKQGALTSIFHRVGTWRNRLTDFADSKDLPPDSVDLIGKGAQKNHARIAIVSSNVIGRGPGNSVERDFLYQAFSDFIYAIIIEEMGFFGALFVAMLYIILLFRTGRIASRCENNFPAFLAMGLALLLVTQALFNMCVAVGLAPVTGQPLPLISKGGTSTMINCIYVGVILSVSRSAKKRELGPNEQDDESLVVA